VYPTAVYRETGGGGGRKRRALPSVRRPHRERTWSWCLRLLAGLSGAVIAAVPAAAAPPPDDIDSYPLAHGNYTAPDNYGWLYFKTPGGWGCGIGPNGGPVGCDAVARDAPPGTNQTYAIIYAPAEYRHSDTASFTHNVDVLLAGQRLQSLGGACAVDNQGAVHCQTGGGHGFILSPDHGVLW
ncbi:hypothetical protein MTAB308_5351, partial [Mycobacterium terramassiliense]